MTAMRTSAAGRKAIAQREGNKLTAYKDSVGIPTIGVGHTSAAGPPAVKMGMKITAAQSDEILTRDLQGVEADVNRLVTAPLSQNQFDALVSLVFNIGGTAFRKSTLLKRLNASDYAGAASQFLVWNKATVNGKRVALKGLATRREAERKQFVAGGAKAAAVAVVPEVTPSDIYTDKTTIEIVQRKLYDLGYTEVGSRRADGSFDGSFGGMTKAAILIFRNDNGLPAVDVIDRPLLDALDTAPKRKLARNDATAEKVRETVPEAKSNWLNKILAAVVAVPALIGGVVDGAMDGLGSARGYVEPLLSDVPSWAWLLLAAGIAGYVFWNSRKSEQLSIAAYQSGERR